jgi:hypothetical protein
MSTDEAIGGSIVGGIHNYQDWKFQVKNYLELRGLWKAVNPNVNRDGVVTSVDTVKDRQTKSIISMLIDLVCLFL